MKVLCIKESVYPGDKDPKTGILKIPKDISKIVPQKDIVYTVNKIVTNNCALEGTINCTWYVLNETGAYQQHSSLFKIIEIDDSLIEEIIFNHLKVQNIIPIGNLSVNHLTIKRNE